MLAADIILPHDGVGGTTPIPRKLIADSYKIALATLNVAVTIIIGIVFGSK
ncbi:hypothetical protein D3C80_1946340 [compost metagenome]